MLSALFSLIASLTFPSFGVLKNAGSNQLDIVATKIGNVFVAQSPEQFTHDADGNVTSDGRWQYTWDAENRLIGVETLSNLPVSVPRQRLEFSYDASFRRIEKKVYSWSGSTWQLASELRFVYDGWNMLAEVGTTGSVVRSYAWGLDLAGSQAGAGGVGGLLWQTDHLSSSVSICGYDGNGKMMQPKHGECLLGFDGATASRYSRPARHPVSFHLPLRTLQHTGHPHPVLSSSTS